MVVTKYKIKKNIPSPLRFALLTDFHDGECGEVIRMLENENADAFLVCGDFIHNSHRFQNGIKLLEKLSNEKPTFCSLGNHETLYDGDIRKMVIDSGAVLLESSFTEFRGVKLGGISSGFMYGSDDGTRFNTPKPDVEWLNSFAAESGMKILLSHHPEYYAQYIKSTKIDLTLSGHAHGGQWRFFGKGVFAPGQGFFPKYTAGVHDDRLIISRGLGNPHSIPRFNNPTELVIVEIK